MLTLVALVWLFTGVALMAAAIARLVDGLDRRRLVRVATQVHVTDAIHRVLGPIVAPTVGRHRSGAWTVTMGLAPDDLETAGRLAEIAQQTLGQERKPARIVFVPRARP